MRASTMSRQRCTACTSRTVARAMQYRFSSPVKSRTPRSRASDDVPRCSFSHLAALVYNMQDDVVSISYNRFL